MQGAKINVYIIQSRMAFGAAILNAKYGTHCVIWICIILLIKIAKVYRIPDFWILLTV